MRGDLIATWNNQLVALVTSIFPLLADDGLTIEARVKMTELATELLVGRLILAVARLIPDVAKRMLTRADEICLLRDAHVEVLGYVGMLLPGPGVLDDFECCFFLGGFMTRESDYNTVKGKLGLI